MTKSFLLFTALFASIISFSQGGCVKMFVKEHYHGDPICLLNEGDFLEVCFDNKTVTGGSCKFYIKDVIDTYEGMKINLSLDNVYWAPKYGELIINTKNQNFGFNIGGSIGAYSYYNQTEIAKIKTNEREQAKLEEQIRVSNAIANDKVLNKKIVAALSSNNCFMALQLYEELYSKDESLKTQIDKCWNSSKIEYDALYKQYNEDFKKIKAEYYENSSDFTNRYKEHISESKLTVNGFTAYLNTIYKTQNLQLKKKKENKLDNSSWFYSKQKNQHLLVPLNVVNNNREFYYDTSLTNKYKICVQFDTTCQSYFTMIGFYKNDSLVVEEPIINVNEYNVQVFTMPYPEELKELSEQVINIYGEELLTIDYPLLTINLGSFEAISINKLNKIEKPEEGKKNNMYEKCRESFKIIDDSIQQYCSREIKLCTPNAGFYHPGLIYYAKKMYPNADSLIFIYSNNEINKILNEKRAINLFRLDNSSYYVVPLQKGSIEIKQKQDQYNWIKGQEPYILYIYDKNGNYTDIEVGIIAESKISLSEINIEKLELDSAFYEHSNNIDDLIHQCPIQYEQYQLGIPDENFYNKKLNLDYSYYYFSEDLCVKKLPLYNSNKLFSYGLTVNRHVLVPPSSICFNLCLFNSPYDLVEIKNWKYLSSYFKYITKYIENKNEKDLLKADKYLEEYINILNQN